LEKLVEVDIVGVNNRSLKTMTTDINQSFRLADKIPSGILKISESGISKAETLIKLKEAGFNGFLIGEYFMQHSSPNKACQQLIEEVENSNSLLKGAGYNAN
jgi:indole-3-glycerol phosphate synthase